MGKPGTMTFDQEARSVHTGLQCGVQWILYLSKKSSNKPTRSRNAHPLPSFQKEHRLKTRRCTSLVFLGLEPAVALRIRTPGHLPSWGRNHGGAQVLRATLLRPSKRTGPSQLPSWFGGSLCFCLESPSDPLKMVGHYKKERGQMGNHFSGVMESLGG